MHQCLMLGAFNRAGRQLVVLPVSLFVLRIRAMCAIPAFLIFGAPRVVLDAVAAGRAHARAAFDTSVAKTAVWRCVLSVRNEPHLRSPSWDCHMGA